MPPRFSFPANEELWIPVNTEFPPKPRNDRNIQTVNIVARLKPGVSIEQANETFRNSGLGNISLRPFSK